MRRQGPGNAYTGMLFPMSRSRDLATGELQ
jgi:hypothetical protein